MDDSFDALAKRLSQANLPRRRPLTRRRAASRRRWPRAASEPSAAAPVPLQPSVWQLSPANGPASGGTTVTITGAGFTGARAVSFGNAAAASFNVVSDTQLTAVTPAGSGQVVPAVTNPSGSSQTRPQVIFTFNAGS